MSEAAIGAIVDHLQVQSASPVTEIFRSRWAHFYRRFFGLRKDFFRLPMPKPPQKRRLWPLIVAKSVTPEKILGIPGEKPGVFDRRNNRNKLNLIANALDEDEIWSVRANNRDYGLWVLAEESPEPVNRGFPKNGRQAHYISFEECALFYLFRFFETGRYPNDPLGTACLGSRISNTGDFPVISSRENAIETKIIGPDAFPIFSRRVFF